MKIYKVYIDMILVLGRLKKFSLGSYNYTNPIIFQTASDPDDACFRAYTGLSDLIMRQHGGDPSKSVKFTKDIMYDVRVTKISLASNESKFDV